MRKHQLSAMAGRLLVIGLATLLRASLRAQGGVSVDTLASPVRIPIEASHHSHGSAVGHAVAAVELPDGRIAYALSHGGSVRVSRLPVLRGLESGRYVFDDVGEFKHIAWIGLCGNNRLGVLDQVSARLVMMTPEGSTLASTLIAEAASITGPASVACSTRGSFVMQALGRSNADSGLVASPILFLDDAGREVWRSVPIANALVFRFRGGAAPNPFRATTSLAFVSNAPVALIASEARVVAVSTDFVSVPLVSRVDGGLIRLSSSDTREIVDRYTASIRGPIASEIHAKLLNSADGSASRVLQIIGGSSVAFIALRSDEPRNGVSLQPIGFGRTSCAKLFVPAVFEVLAVGKHFVIGSSGSSAAPELVIYQRPVRPEEKCY